MKLIFIVFICVFGVIHYSLCTADNFDNHRNMVNQIAEFSPKFLTDKSKRPAGMSLIIKQFRLGVKMTHLFTENYIYKKPTRYLKEITLIPVPWCNGTQTVGV